MKDNILAKFEYNGKTYVYYVKFLKPKNLLYGYLENNIIREIKDPNDISIMQEAYKKIFISNDQSNHVKLSTAKYNGKLFQIMYDKVSGLKFFYEIKAGKFYQPNEVDGTNLFNIYNNFEITDAGNFDRSFEKEMKAKKRRKAVLKITLSLGTALVMASTSFSAYTGYIAPNYPYTQIVQTVKNLTSAPKTDFSEEKIVEAINNNPNLTNEEKQFYFDELPYLIKNKRYVDQNEIVRKFQSAKIEYINGPKEDEPWVKSIYDPIKNIITIYNCYSFETASKTAIRHEVRHNASKAYDAFGQGVYDATEAAIAFEHGDEEVYTSTRNIYYQMILYKIIGTEPFIAYSESGDVTFLIKALMEIIPNEQDAIELISALTEIMAYNKEITICINTNNAAGKTVAEENLNNAHLKVISLLEKYFRMAKGSSIYEDAFSMLCIKKATGQNIKIELLFNDGQLYEITNYELTKGYFLDGYIQNYQKNYLICNNLRDFKIELSGDASKLTRTENGYIINTGLDSLQSYLKNTNHQEIGNGLTKAIESLISYEQNSSSENNYLSYKEQVIYLKILCEIIGTEPFEKYLANGDISEITIPLTELLGDDNSSYVNTLIDDIDLTTKYYEQSVNLTDLNNPIVEKIPGNVSEDLSKARSDIYTILGRCFNVVWQYADLSQDIITNLYYKELLHSFTFGTYAEDNWEMYLQNDSLPAGEYIVINNDSDVDIVKNYFVNLPQNDPLNATVVINDDIRLTFAPKDNRLVASGSLTNKYGHNGKLVKELYDTNRYVIRSFSDDQDEMEK